MKYEVEKTSKFEASISLKSLGLGAPVHGDAEEVEDGGGGEDHVHGLVHVTQPHREQPVAVQEDVDGIEHHRPH